MGFSFKISGFSAAGNWDPQLRQLWLEDFEGQVELAGECLGFKLKAEGSIEPAFPTQARLKFNSIQGLPAFLIPAFLKLAFLFGKSHLDPGMITVRENSVYFPLQALLGNETGVCVKIGKEAGDEGRDQQEKLGETANF